MPVVLNIVDTTTPIVATAYEGIALSFEGPGEFKVELDETSIYQIA
jgi:hypothetical protein